jgi:hypothetical protein
MRAYRSGPLLILPALLLVSGCWATVRGGWRVEATYSAPAEVIVSAPPPALRADVDPPPPPRQDAVWVDGYWKWEGRWVWEAGHWETPRAGYVWVAPVAHDHGGRITYYGGYWAPADRPPPPRYRERSTVVVAHPPRVIVRAPRPEPEPRVIVRPAQPEPEPRVVVRPPQRPPEPEPEPRVVVRPPQPQPEPRVVVRPPQPQPEPRVVVRPPQRPPEPEPEPRVVVRPPQPQPGVVVRPPAQQPPTIVAEGEGRVVAPRPREPQPPARVDQPSPNVQPGVRVPTPRVIPHQEANTDAPSPREQPNVRQPTPRVVPHAEANAEVGSPRDPGGIRQAPERGPITCRIDAVRAPEGGLVGITGTGFGASASARIGGRVAEVVERGAGRMVVRVPGSAGGGNVTLIEGNRTGNCGMLSISSR